MSPRFQTNHHQWEDEAELFRNIIHKGAGSFTSGALSGKQNLSEADRLLESLNESVKSLDYFITDLGFSPRCKDPNTAQVRMIIPRYGVWEMNNRGVEVLEASEDLTYLKGKYRTERVLRIQEVV